MTNAILYALCGVVLTDLVVSASATSLALALLRRFHRETGRTELSPLPSGRKDMDVACSVSKGILRYKIGGWGAPLGIDLYVDGLSALMLLMTAVLGLAVSVYATSYFGQDQDNDSHQYYWPLSLFLFAARNALFLSRDLFNH